MAWTPGLHSLSRHFIAKNLLAWIKDAGNGGARQAEALAWAKAQLAFAGSVPNFAAVYNSSLGRTRNRFPDLMLVRRATRFQPSEDGHSLPLVHTLGFEMEIADEDPDVLTEKCEVYSVALKSMIWACPAETLTNGVSTEGRPTVDITDDDGDQLRGGGAPWLQTPRIIVAVSLAEVRNG